MKMWRGQFDSVKDNIGMLYNGVERAEIRAMTEGVSLPGDRSAIFLKLERYKTVDGLDGSNSDFSWNPGMFCYVPSGRPADVAFAENRVASVGLLFPGRISREIDSGCGSGYVSRGVVDGIALYIFLALFKLKFTEDPLKIDHVTLALIRCIRGWYGEPAPKNMGAAKITRAVAYMQDNYAKRVTTDELSDVACVSPYHFIRQFKKIIGFTPHEYIMRVRADRARALLLAGRLSLASVALTCGYANQAHMTTHFRRTTGHTPRQYRMLTSTREPDQEQRRA